MRRKRIRPAQTTAGPDKGAASAGRHALSGLADDFVSPESSLPFPGYTT